LTHTGLLMEGLIPPSLRDSSFSSARLSGTRDFHGSRLPSWYWTLHTRPPAQCFRPVTGCNSGSLTSPGSSYLIAATPVRARFLLARKTVCGSKCFRMKGTSASIHFMRCVCVPSAACIVVMFIMREVHLQNVDLNLQRKPIRLS
jgi:hypothetical protein